MYCTTTHASTARTSSTDGHGRTYPRHGTNQPNHDSNSTRGLSPAQYVLETPHQLRPPVPAPWQVAARGPEGCRREGPRRVTGLRRGLDPVPNPGAARDRLPPRPPTDGMELDRRMGRSPGRVALACSAGRGRRCAFSLGGGSRLI